MNSYRVYGDAYGLFFIAYNLVVAYFFLNLFTGILFKYFNEGFSKEKKLAPDDKKAPKYYDFLTQIIKADSHYDIWLRPNKNSIQYYIREFAESKLLDKIITSCILLNLLIMMINYEGCDSTFKILNTWKVFKNLLSKEIISSTSISKIENTTAAKSNLFHPL